MPKLPVARPNAAVTVDCVVFGYLEADKRLKVLLVERGREPFKGFLALPGGFVEAGESLDEAARRELQEETGLASVYFEQLYTFGGVNRDPRGRVVSVAHFALTHLRHRVKAGSDAAKASWHDLDILLGSTAGRGITKVTNLAFDHMAILDMAIKRLRAKIRYAPIGFHLLPKTFTLRDLQDVYEAVLGHQLDESNFRKRITATGVLVAAGVKRVAGRPPAKLYKFVSLPESVLADFTFNVTGRK